MADSDYVCEECRSEISAEATTCPECQYEPAAAHRKYRSRQALLASLCFFTVIGAPLGIFLFWRARKHGKKAKTATPAVPA